MHILWPWRVYNLFIAHCSHLHEKGEEGQYAPLKRPTLGSRGFALISSISLLSFPPPPRLTLTPHLLSISLLFQNKTQKYIFESDFRKI